MHNHNVTCVQFATVSHSGASHSHTVCVISSAIKQCTLKLTSLGPVSQRVHAIIQPHIPQAWFGSCCCWKQINGAIEYIQYKMVSFPQENVQSVQFVDVSSVPECCLRGPI